VVSQPQALFRELDVKEIYVHLMMDLGTPCANINFTENHKMKVTEFLKAFSAMKSNFRLVM
jgi:hypothetical protein